MKPDSKSSGRRAHWWLVVAAGLSILAAGYWWPRGGADAEPGGDRLPGGTDSGRNAGLRPAEGGQHPDFEAAMRAMSSNAAAGGAVIDGLRKSLRRVTAEEASQTIRRFLESGRDARTGAGFEVGSDGTLAAAPSLRTFAMDEWSRVDVAGAGAHAETVLRASGSADEWAVALRNYARWKGAEQGKAFLATRLESMWRHEPWLKEPSVGFLEAFDVAVFVGGSRLVPALAAFVREQDRPDLAYAANLALDRLVMKDPVPVLTVLRDGPTLLAGREKTRAGYFARVDVRQADQRALVEGYLATPFLAAEELEQFAGLFPNANFMVSRNLLTPSGIPHGAEIRARDSEALVVVGRWLVEPRFERWRPQLTKTRDRLEAYAAEGR